MSDQPTKPDRRRNDKFRVHTRKGRAGTLTTPTGKIRPPKALQAARRERAALAARAGVDEKTLAVLTDAEIKQRIGMNEDDIKTLNAMASGKSVPRNSLSILGAQKLKLSVGGLLQQNLNIKTDLADAVAEAAARIAAKSEEPGGESA